MFDRITHRRKLKTQSYGKIITNYELRMTNVGAEI